MGRSAHDADRPDVDHCATMDDRGILHRIEDDLRENWVEEWAGDGVEAIEQYLAKHLAFQSFLDDAATA
jgi:hypothetical protein